MPGPPINPQSNIAYLLSHNVTVGIGTEEQWNARNLRFDAAWAMLESSGEISKAQAIEMASVNVEKLLGLNLTDTETELVVTGGGGLFDFSKVIAILSTTGVEFL
jgi:hypothetical protein